MVQHHIDAARHLVEGMRREAAFDQLDIDAFNARTRAVLDRLTLIEEGIAQGNPPPRRTVPFLGLVGGGSR